MLRIVALDRLRARSIIGPARGLSLERGTVGLRTIALSALDPLDRLGASPRFAGIPGCRRADAGALIIAVAGMLVEVLVETLLVVTLHGCSESRRALHGGNERATGRRAAGG